MISTISRNRPGWGRWLAGGALAAALLATVAPPAESQATLRGRVIDSEFGHPLPSSVVHLRGAPVIHTDSLGRFEIPDLPRGDVELTIELLGYGTGVFRVFVPDSGVVERSFGLDFTGDRLPDIVVQSRAEQLMPRYLDFERRRERGMGAYLRWDEIAQKGFHSVGEALRTIRGVRIRCDQQRFECYAYLSRTPNCQPSWWVDGVEVRSFHENTPIRDVYGIEVYRGAGEVPAMFAGSTAGCGVIVVWTKSRPFQ